MKELTDRLVNQTGISYEQATQCIDIVKQYIKEKFPIAAGAVDQVLGNDAPGSAPDDY
jgi:hypothetical protein